MGFQWCIQFTGIAIVFGAKANDQVLPGIRKIKLLLVIIIQQTTQTRCTGPVASKEKENCKLYECMYIAGDISDI